MRKNPFTLFARLTRFQKPVPAKKTADVPLLKKVDHSLACTLARELYRLQKKADANQLRVENILPAIGRLNDELASRGYSTRDMTGLPYHDGLRVSVINFTASPALVPGQERIERTIRPEIRYKGRVIDAGSVEVAVAPETTRLKIPETTQQRSVV